MFIRSFITFVRTVAAPVAIALTGGVVGTAKNEYEVNKLVDELENQKRSDDPVSTTIQEVVQEVREETQYDKPILIQYNKNNPLMVIMDERNMSVRDAYTSDASVLIVDNAKSFAKPENREILKNTLRHEIGGHLKGNHSQLRSAYHPGLLFGGWSTGYMLASNPMLATSALCVAVLMSAPMCGSWAVARYLDRRQETQADNAIVNIDSNSAKREADSFRSRAAKNDESIGVFGSIFASHPSSRQRAQNLDHQVDRKEQAAKKSNRS